MLPSTGSVMLRKMSCVAVERIWSREAMTDATCSPSGDAIGCCDAATVSCGQTDDIVSLPLNTAEVSMICTPEIVLRLAVNLAVDFTSALFTFG